MNLVVIQGCTEIALMVITSLKAQKTSAYEYTLRIDNKYYTADLRILLLNNDEDVADCEVLISIPHSADIKNGSELKLVSNCKERIVYTSIEEPVLKPISSSGEVNWIYTEDMAYIQDTLECHTWPSMNMKSKRSDSDSTFAQPELTKDFFGNDESIEGFESALQNLQVLRGKITNRTIARPQL